MGVIDRLEREAHRLRRENIPFIAYCHSSGSCNGITICKLQHYVDESRKMPGDPKRYYEENTLATGFLRSLNKCIRDSYKGFSLVNIIAYLLPLTNEEKENVLKLVPTLKNAEVLD